MTQSRIEYAVLTISTFVLFLLFSQRFLLVLTLVLLVLPFIAFGIVKEQKEHISLSMQVKETAVQKDQVEFHVHVENTSRFNLTRGICLTLQVSSTVVSEVKRERVLLEFDGKQSEYVLSEKAEDCGEFRLHIEKAQVVGLFGLVAMRFPSCRDVSTLVYPQWIQSEVVFANQATGFSEDTGAPKNTRGNDRSEVLDLREYVVGDDVRNIHWKLSSKMDTLFVKEAGNSYHYDVLLLNDIGFTKEGESITREELNTDMAVMFSLAETLVDQKVPFCIGSVSEQGIALSEIQNENDLDRCMKNLFSTPLPEECGKGISYFSLDHYEDIFSRVLYTTSGKVSHNLHSLNGKVSAAIISVEDGQSQVEMISIGSVQFMQIPAHLESGTRIKVIF